MPGGVAGERPVKAVPYADTLDKFRQLTARVLASCF